MQAYDQPGLGKVACFIISTAEPPVRDTFARFHNKGAAKIIVDYRYNIGSPVRLVEVMGDLMVMGRDRLASDMFSLTAYRPSKSMKNSTRLFRATPNSRAAIEFRFHHHCCQRLGQRTGDQFQSALLRKPADPSGRKHLQQKVWPDRHLLRRM